MLIRRKEAAAPVRRYYFKVADHKDEFADETGEDFQSLEDAKAHARKIAQELATDAGHYRGYAVIVTDEHGSELARIPVQSK